MYISNMYVGTPNNVYEYNNDAFRAYAITASAHYRQQRFRNENIYNLKTFTMKKSTAVVQTGSEGDKTIIMIPFPFVYNNNHDEI